MMLDVERDEARRTTDDVLDLGVLGRTETLPGDGAGATDPVGPHRRRLVSASGVVVVAVGLALLAHHPSSPPPAVPRPAAAAVGDHRSSGQRRATPSPPAVLVTEAGHPLLGAVGDWDLFAEGDRVLVRIHPASGRVTRTDVPQIANVGDDALVPVRGRVLLHPRDYQKGYVVPDGRLPSALPLPLDGNGPLLPGPDPDHVWIALDQRRTPSLELVSLDGTATGTSAAAPRYATGGPFGDGAGYVLYEGVGGLYRAGRGAERRVSEGALLAAGPTGWLTVDCDARAVCRTVLHGRAGGAHVVKASIGPHLGTGVLSPDGRTVALSVAGAVGMIAPVLVDLTSGDRRPVSLSLLDTGTDTGAGGAMAWSPDGRWLLAVDAPGRIEAVDPASGRTSTLVAGLPTVVQLAVRPG